jgi:iron complex outermembrane receptor protein
MSIEKNRKGCSVSVVAAVSAAIVGSASHGLAQDAVVLEEVVITAEKRATNLQDTPISIAAFSGDELDKAGIGTTDGLANLTPGLVVQKEVIGKVVIRGVGTENFSVGSDPGVAIHQDGVYVARSSVAIFDFFDMERVEVLRGPQGTLYGRNATGGVINVISRKPETEFGGYAKIDLGNYAKKRVEAVLNAPLSDSTAFRVSALWAERDGYTENKFANARARGFDQLDNQELWAARAQLSFSPSETFEGLLQVEASRDDSNPTAFKYFTHAAGDPNIYWTLPTDKRLASLREVSQGYELNIINSNRVVPSIGRAYTDAANLKLTWNLGNVQLMSQTAYRETVYSWLNDGDGTDVFFVTYTRVPVVEHRRRGTQMDSRRVLSQRRKQDVQWSRLHGTESRRPGKS